MKHAEIKAMMAEVAPVIREYAASALSPVMARLDAMEKQIGAMPAPLAHEDAKLVILAEIESVSEGLPAMVAAEVDKAVGAIPAPPELPDIPAMIAEAVATIPPPKDGEDADMDVVAVLVEAKVKELGETLSAETAGEIKAEVELAIAAIPPPRDGQDGKSVTVEDVAPLIEESVSAAFSALPVPKDGKDADMEAVAEMIGEKVAEAFAGVELPKDGKDGRDGIDGKDGADGLNGRDGLDAVEFLRGADGHLICTMSNGTTRDLGQVNGKDGADGLSFEDFAFDVVLVDERTFMLKWFNKGKMHTSEFTLPVVLDRGVYKAGETYAAGDAVSYGGSMWIAQEETTEKPDGGKGWRLSVKRGRDGKDGTPKPPSEPKPLKVG